MNKYLKSWTKNRSAMGDTIIEVLLAIGVASLAISITYATAQRSLQRAITAKEHNEALNIIENQIADLQLRFNKSVSTTAFSNKFGADGSENHFCLNDSATDPASSAWLPINNLGSPSQNTPLTDANYKPACQQPGAGTTYFVDIIVQQGSGNLSYRDYYQITVRWAPLSGAANNQASLFYRLDESPSQVVGYSGTQSNPQATVIPTLSLTKYS